MFDGRGCGSISGCAESRAGGTEPTPGGCRGARSPSGHCWPWVLVGRSGTCPCCPPQRVPSPAQPAGQQTGAEGCLGCSAPPQSRPGVGDWIGAGPQRSWGSSRSALGSPGPGGTAGSTAGIGPGNGSVLTGCARYCYHYSYQYRHHYCYHCPYSHCYDYRYHCPYHYRYQYTPAVPQQPRVTRAIKARWQRPEAAHQAPGVVPDLRHRSHPKTKGEAKSRRIRVGRAWTEVLRERGAAPTRR